MSWNGGNLKTILMIYDVNELKREIRIALDQNKSSEPLRDLGDIDTLSFDDIVGSKIADAAKIVILHAPIHLLGSGIPFGKGIEWKSAEGHGSGSVLLPDDFLRLVVFQMSDWGRAVSEAISPSDAQYALQSSRFPGVRGCPQKPVVAIVNTGVGMMLEFYSCTGGEGVGIKQATYIPKPRILDETIELSHKIKDAVVYYSAYMVAVTMGQSEQAQQLLNISQSLLNDTTL